MSLKKPFESKKTQQMQQKLNKCSKNSTNVAKKLNKYDKKLNKYESRALNNGEEGVLESMYKVVKEGSV